MSDIQYWHTNLGDEATRRRDQPSFHVFAEGMHSDIRGQVFNVTGGESLSLWSDKWPNHLFIIIVINGELDAELNNETLNLRPQSQLVVLPGVACKLVSKCDSAIEVISFLSKKPVSEASHDPV